MAIDYTLIPLTELVFTPVVHVQSDVTYKIADALQEALERHGIRKGRRLAIPSLMTLAKAYHTNHLDIHDAFQHLRRLGFDYVLQGMDAPIPFWFVNSPDQEG